MKTETITKELRKYFTRQVFFRLSAIFDVFVALVFSSPQAYNLMIWDCGLCIKSSCEICGFHFFEPVESVWRYRMKTAPLAAMQRDNEYNVR